MNHFLQGVIFIIISFILVIIGCNSKTLDKSSNNTQPAMNTKKNLDSNKDNKEGGILIEKISTLKINNSGTDQTELILEWNAESIKGIKGHFDIFRRYGHGEYIYIAKTVMYDGNHPDLSKYTWKERDRLSGVYMHADLKSEPRLPLNRYIFQIRFQPLNEAKYRSTLPSNEVEAYFIPSNAKIAMYDIVETLQNAYTQQCGFFSSWPIESQKATHSGHYSGMFTRETNIDNQVVYNFDQYSNFGSIYITGQLKSNLKQYKDKIGTEKIQPLNVSGNLNINGIYKADIQIQNLKFNNECGTSLTDGEIRIHYMHPINGQMKAGFKGRMIPPKFLYYIE